MLETSSYLLGKSSGTFGYLRKSLEKFRNFRLAFGEFLENLRKSSEHRPKRRYQCVYVINKIIDGCLYIWNISSRVQLYIYLYRFEGLKRHSISTRVHVLSSMYQLYSENPFFSLRYFSLQHSISSLDSKRMPRSVGVGVEYVILGRKHISYTISQCRMLFLEVANSRNRTKGYRLKRITMRSSVKRMKPSSVVIALKSRYFTYLSRIRFFYVTKSWVAKRYSRVL